MLIGNYQGCFRDIRDSNANSTVLGFLTIDTCIQICNIKNYIYASLQQGFLKLKYNFKIKEI